MKKKQFLREIRAEINRFEDIVADAVGIIVTQGAAAYIDKHKGEPVYVVECPICKADLLPVNLDGVPVLPRHERQYGPGTDTTFCTGSAMPVSNTDKELKGD